MSDSKAIQYFNDNAAALSAQYNSKEGMARLKRRVINLFF